MPHHTTLSNFLPIFIIVLISCNSSTCTAVRLLPRLKPESPLLPNSEAPPPHQDWPFPKLQWPMTNSPKHEQYPSTQPKSTKFPPWFQDPTKAEEPTPLEHHSPPKFEEPNLPPKPEKLRLLPHPKLPPFHGMHTIPKPKWQMQKLPPYHAVPKWPIPKLSPKAEKPTSKNHQVPALSPLYEMPSLLSPKLAPLPSAGLAPSSTEPKRH